MRRRKLLSKLVWACLVALPQLAAAQASARVYRVAVLRPGAAPPPVSSPGYLQTALGELGYVEGRNLVLDVRYSGPQLERLPALATEMIQAGADVIVAIGDLPARVAKAATTRVPIILFGNFEPVELGLVDSLARPGGNLTGVLIAPDGSMAGKRLELLMAAVPQARRIGFLTHPARLVGQQQQETRQAAAALGVELIVAELRAGDYAAAFAELQAGRAGAVLVGSSQIFLRDRRQIIELAARHRLPAMYEWREQVADGGLMAYSTSQYGRFQRLAAYVDRVLKGTKPGDLPIDRPTTFQLVVNLKTAKAIGLTLPAPLQLRIDEVID